MNEKKCRLTKNEILAFVSAMVFYIVAHGLCFSNRIYSHDYLQSIYKNDAAWQVALGRFLQPVLMVLRGSISVPWVIETITMVCVAVTAVLLYRLFQMESKTEALCLSGILSCNLVWTTSNASYMPWVDSYGICLLLSVWAVYLLRKNTWKGRILAVVSLVISLGFYQAYVFVYITLVVLQFIWNLRTKEDTKKELLSVCWHVGALVLAGLLYFIGWKIFQKALNIWTSDSYNGLASLGDYEGYSVGQLLKLSFVQFINFFLHPQIFVTFTVREISLGIFWVWVLRVTNLVAACLILVGTFRSLKGRTVFQKVCKILLTLLLPFIMNGISILSKGMVHDLMIFPYLFVYVYAIAMGGELFKGRKICKRIYLAIPFAILIWANIVVANQAYYKRDLQEEATLSLMTRIVDRVEQEPAYEAGVTPVAFAGSFMASEEIYGLPEFQDITLYSFSNTSLTYVGLPESYIKYVMQVNMNLTKTDLTDERIESMPCFPKEGSVAMIDGIMVIKISDLH